MNNGELIRGRVGMANSELTINDCIAAVLREINTDWRVHSHVSSENTEAILICVYQKPGPH